MLASLTARRYRIGFNCFRPPAAPGQMTYIASDWQEVRIKRLLSWRTRNYVGMTFGGSIYGGVDPVDAEGSRPRGVRKTVTVSTDESKTA